MQTRPFGTTGLAVTPLGLGAMHLNDDRVTEAEAGVLLNAVLDLGVNLVDTARGYGLSEERIGRHLASRRGEFILSTKVGYGIPGFEDWTGACILAGVDAALARMRCGHLDIVHLHSCPLPVLQRGDVIEALEACVRAGKVRVAAYAGDNAELDFAIGCERFASVQTSVSVCDQVNLQGRLPALTAGGMGVIAKRPLAGAVWTRASRPDTFAEGHYWDRWRALGLDRLPTSLSPGEVALRFAAHAPGVDACIVGTGNLEHFKRNLAIVEQGPLPGDLSQAIRAAFQAKGRDWPGLI